MAGVLMLLGAASTAAQTFYMTPMPETRPRLSFRFLHPTFKEYRGPDATSLSGGYQLAVSIPMSKAFEFVASMPLFRESFKITFTDESGFPVSEGTISESALGNLYVGVQSRIPLGDQIMSSASLGFYLPTAKERYKYYATIYSRMATEALELRSFLANAVVCYTNYAVRMQTPGQVGGIFGIEAGPELFIPTEHGDPELLAHYGLSIGIRFPHGAAIGELLGLALITEDLYAFAEQFDHFAAFGAQVTDWPVRPGIFYQIPLDDEYRYNMKGVLGIKVDAVLP